MILEITKFGHPTLRLKGKKIERITDEIRQLSLDMLETMYDANGVGLAAQQVNRALMLAVIDTRPSQQPSTLEMDGQAADLESVMPLILVNPILKNPGGEQNGEEGCLSVPEVTADIRRAQTVEVEAQTMDGKKITYRCSGLLSRAVQHEVDHLNGILFLDRMDPVTRAGFSGQLKRLQKNTQATLARLKKKK